MEKNVLSGLTFWDEGDESLLADMDSGSEEEIEKKPTPITKRNLKDKGKKNKNDDRFEEGGHRPLKNVLATKVSEKIGKEKREKI